MAYINVDEVYILDNTGLQVDMATDIPFADAGFTDAQKEQARKNIAAGGTNPNLLDNPWFTVRQRGDGPFTGNVYGVDRWRGGNSRTTITGNSGYITLATNSSGNGILRQILPQTYEGTYTFSAVVGGSGSGALFLQDSGGTIIGNAVEFTTTGDTQLVTLTFTTSGTAIGCVAVRVDVSNTIEIVCAKLERGSVSTLSNDVPPDYGTELLKCQMYLRSIYARSGGTYVGIGMGFSSNSYEIELPFSMRATPTASYSGTIEIYAPSGTHTVSAVSVVSASTDTVELRFTVSGTVTTYENGHIFMANGAKILLSAEL